MTIITNTTVTYSAKGIREELANVIFNISPAETPLISNAGRESVGNVFFEWQTDALATAATNAQLEADDLGSTFDAVTYTVRLGNYCQISRKTVIVGGTEEVVNKAGRTSELAYQIAKKGLELKRDMEFSLLANAANNAGAAATARVSGTLVGYIKTNTDKGAGGADPSYTTTPNSTRTDGTLRAFTETQLKNVAKLVFVAGGNAKTIMTTPAQKQVLSGFGGIATRTYYQNDAVTSAIIGAADVYISDFGTLSVIPNRFQRAVNTTGGEAFFIDWDLVSMVYLRPFQVVPLAKTGDAEKRMLLVEYGLKVKQEAGLGLVTDLSGG